jgi:exo-1,4-beta-D-glucosaminidase
MRLSWALTLMAICLIIVFCFIVLSCRKPSKAPQFEIALNEEWHIHAAQGLAETGKSISTAGFDVQNWYPSNAPSTVLATLLKNGVYKDPFFGKNMESIPTEQFKQPWWNSLLRK